MNRNLNNNGRRPYKGRWANRKHPKDLKLIRKIRERLHKNKNKNKKYQEYLDRSNKLLHKINSAYHRIKKAIRILFS